MCDRKRILTAVMLACLLAAAGCAGHNKNPGGGTPGAVETLPPPTPDPVRITAMDAVEDLSAAVGTADPYAALNPNMIEVYNPDRELYNALYRAVDGMEPGLDVSGYDLTGGEKYTTAECLYSEAGYGLFYLDRFKLSRDGGAITFTYREDGDAVRRDRETYYARMSHLLYNVAPKHYTDLQKLMAVYDYICETSDYSGDMSDETTMSPYGILVKGQGICGGFAGLMEYVLNRVGVTARYVCNEPHAWNLVNLDGQWYHTDVTWGAGYYGEPANHIRTFLMDDTARQESLETAGMDIGDIIEGYPRADAEAPPACTDTRYDRYADISFCYAVDIDGGKVYYADMEGIKRMNLEGTGVEILSDQYAYQMAYYGGVLYYLNGDGYLYQLEPGYEPVLIDVGAVCLYLKMEGTALVYGPNDDGSGAGAISFSGYDPDAVRDAGMAETARVSRSRSFKMEVTFSGEMDAAADWADHVYLVNGDGDAVPLHLIWSGDGKTLTIRPKTCVADMETLTLYVMKGAPAANGTTLPETRGMGVEIVSDYVFPAGVE